MTIDPLVVFMGAKTPPGAPRAATGNSFESPSLGAPDGAGVDVCVFSSVAVDAGSGFIFVVGWQAWMLRLWWFWHLWVMFPEAFEAAIRAACRFEHTFHGYPMRGGFVHQRGVWIDGFPAIHAKHFRRNGRNVARRLHAFTPVRVRRAGSGDFRGFGHTAVRREGFHVDRKSVV